MRAVLNEGDIKLLLSTYHSEKRNAWHTPVGSDLCGDYHEGFADGVRLVLDLIRDQVESESE